MDMMDGSGRGRMHDEWPTGVLHRTAAVVDPELPIWHVNSRFRYMGWEASAY
ncbi:hypothetical protein [Cupriavidus plantarum]|uniref:hypothetical protein n=1 Tax=Cupriavidus plantarum TaxID=942865 RepID=UPI00142D5287|nr:hypothetical protein [Cupriavidus plantarum]NYI02668.1 hypothetical protein [Cupriavidus plantarum]